MRESILQYEEKMWELFDLTKEQMPDLSEFPFIENHIGNGTEILSMLIEFP